MKRQATKTILLEPGHSLTAKGQKHIKELNRFTQVLNKVRAGKEVTVEDMASVQESWCKKYLIKALLLRKLK